MNFPFDVNQLLTEEITKVDNRLQPCRQRAHRYGFKNLQRMLYEVVDKMGDASAKAQNLHGSITTGKRIESSTHRLYIMKDSLNGENDSVVGILKVGTKKLFVYDSSKIQHELDPLCVLDFYVHESRQRKGCGGRLFGFMLKNEGIRAEHLAVDRPSPKFLAFLKKHYSLHNVIPQVNNFVIFNGFFNNRHDTGRGRNIGANYQKANNSPWNPNRPPSGKRVPTPLSEQQYRDGREMDLTPSRQTNNPSDHQRHHLGAGEVMYSRHRATPPSNKVTAPMTPTNGFYPGSAQNRNIISPSPVSNASFSNGIQSKGSSPHMYLTMGTNPSMFRNNQSENLSPNNYPLQRTNSGLMPNNEPANFPPKGPSSTPNFGARYGRDTFPVHADNRTPSAFPAERMQNPNPDKTPAMLPDIHNSNLKGSTSSGPSYQNLQAADPLAQRPPSGKRSYPANNKDTISNPPMLRREGPPQDYKNLVDTNQNYLVKYGRTMSPQQPAAVTPNAFGAQGSKPPYAVASSPFGHPPPSQRNSSWTVMGVIRDQRMNHNLNSQYNPGRLW